MTFNQGQSEETSRWVWIDVDVLNEEPETDIKARLELKALGKNFYMAANQLVR